MNRIIGYTTIDQQYSSKTLTDLELAKRDLLNHFHIKKGEKWTDPNFGSDLSIYIFQPLDDVTFNEIKEAVYEVISYDPRFDLRSDNIVVDQDSHSVTVDIELVYLPTVTDTDLQIKFDTEFAQSTEF